MNTQNGSFLKVNEVETNKQTKRKVQAELLSSSLGHAAFPHTASKLVQSESFGADGATFDSKRSSSPCVQFLFGCLNSHTSNVAQVKCEI